MIKKTLIFLPVALLFLTLASGPLFVPPLAVPWNEEKTDSLGNVVTAHSLGETHSTIHYDLTRLLAVKSGLSPDTAEIVARYCALVDQINAQPGYPYSASLNGTSIPDTFPDWHESIAGTERGGLNNNAQKEYTAQYWHFPFRDPLDTLTGSIVWGTYPVVAIANFKHFTGPPHFWRVPITYNLKHIMQWALYNGGEPGLPDELTPVEVKYADANSSGYQLVQPNSIQAFAIFLHSLADSYSHEECMVSDTIRAHPSTNLCCGLTYHSENEFAYDTIMRAKKHADACVHAIWRALREFKRIHHINSAAFYVTDNNGFQDGDGIPDQLEDDNDGNNTESFLELWKNPSTTDLNGDGTINHSDHTTWRIKLCNNETGKSVQKKLSAGWTWFSLNLTNADRSLGTVLSSLNASDGDYIKNQTVSSTYYQGTGWFGELTQIDPKEMYKIKLGKADTLSFEGGPADPSTHPISIKTGWNWIGYLPQSAKSVTEALSGISPAGEDYIKNQTKSSTFYDGADWFGELNDLEPMDGYMLKTSHTGTLVYPVPGILKDSTNSQKK